MDSSITPSTIPSSSSSIESESPEMVPFNHSTFMATYNRNQQWSSKIIDSNMFFPNSEQFRQTCLPQQFPFQLPIMKYIWTNPSSPKVYQKLIQSCKIFFIKNPMLIMKNVEYYGEKWTCSNITNATYGEHEEINMEKINGNVWLTGELRIILLFEEFYDLASSLIRKSIKCDIHELRLWNQYLSYEELKCLSPGVKNVRLVGCSAYYNKNEPVPLEDIVQLFSSSIRIFMCFNHLYINPKCKNYDNLINVCKNIKYVTFEDNHEKDAIDIPTFYQHLKKSKSHVIFDITCVNYYDIYPVIDEILRTKTFQFIPPVISYHGIEEETLERMLELQSKEEAKYC